MLQSEELVKIIQNQQRMNDLLFTLVGDLHMREVLRTNERDFHWTAIRQMRDEITAQLSRVSRTVKNEGVMKQ